MSTRTLIVCTSFQSTPAWMASSFWRPFVTSHASSVIYASLKQFDRPFVINSTTCRQLPFGHYVECEFRVDSQCASGGREKNYDV